MVYALIAFIIIIAAVALIVQHQRSLRLRAYLMQEAVRNHDFTFHLSTKGLLPGERAMQETLNQLGETIHQQVNQNEVESWERLTRVLTHEIMNSMAPITSISQSLLNRKDVKDTPLEKGILTIHATSQHLNIFIDTYRKLSQLQQPVMNSVHLASLIKDVTMLYPDILWDCSVAESTVVSADHNMLRQVLVNLVKNAVEANAKRICIEEAHTDKNQAMVLYVSNDGQPIPAATIPSIFVPFFTTKRTGNGIGLSISRKMMIQQGGSLKLEDVPRTGYHTTFSIQMIADMG